MEENTNVGSQQNDNTSDPSFDSHESFNDNQEVKPQNQDDVKSNENEKELVGESDSNTSNNQETSTSPSIKSGDEVERNSILKNEVPKESEMEINEFSENKNNSESNLDIKMQMNTNVSLEYCTESQESQTKSSQNQDEVFKMETPLTNQSETVQNEFRQNLGEPQSNDEHQGEANQSESTNSNQELKCIKEQSPRDAFHAAESVLDTEGNTETENQDMGLDKQIHEGIKTCEDNLESQTNSVTSDKMEECLHSQPTQTTNKAEAVNEKIITDNQTTPSIDTNVQNTSYYSSNAENVCTSNAETKYENNMNMERCSNDERTNNGDVISDVSNSDPSAMTVSNERIKEEDMSTEAMDQERDPNMTYESSKRNSPNTQQSTATPPLSSTVPASSNDSSNRIKDDPYNFSEEEDVFSPQLPSRQFSSSNANIPGSDSNDPALERLKAENRYCI